jgi:hypothetical protein
LPNLISRKFVFDVVRPVLARTAIRRSASLALFTVDSGRKPGRLFPKARRQIMQSTPKSEQGPDPPSSISEKEEERIHLELIAISFVIIVFAAIWTYRMGLEANAIDHQLFHVAENVDGLRKNVEMMEKEAKTLQGGPAR